jgi:GNAT superfamily N-acetyltransferase
MTTKRNKREPSIPDKKYFEALKPFVKRVAVGSARQSFFTLCVKASLAKCFEFNLAVRNVKNLDESFFWMPALRGICEDLIVLGKSIVVAGLGGVVTVPTAQRRGFARRLVQHAMKYAETEWHVEAGLLFCRPEMIHYYAALGWQQVESPVMIDQPNGKIASPLPVMVLPFRDLHWPAGTIELESLPW